MPPANLISYLSLRTRASFRRSTVNVMPAPMTMRASVALKLPGAMQLIQVPMIAGASYTVRPSLKRPYALDGVPYAGVNPRSFARNRPRQTLRAGRLSRVRSCLRPPVAVGWRRFWEGSTMRNSKIALLGYGLAAAFILIVAFHSPGKVLMAVDVQAPTVNAK